MNGTIFNKGFYSLFFFIMVMPAFIKKKMNTKLLWVKKKKQSLFICTKKNVSIYESIVNILSTYNIDTCILIFIDFILYFIHHFMLICGHVFVAKRM